MTVKNTIQTRTRVSEDALKGKMGKHTATRFCKYCKQAFEPSRWWSAYCCTEHKNLYWKEIREKAEHLDQCGDIGINQDLIASLREARKSNTKGERNV